MVPPARWREQARGVCAFFALALATTLALVAACFVKIPDVVEGTQDGDSADSSVPPPEVEGGEPIDGCATVPLIEPVDARCPVSDFDPPMVAVRLPQGDIYCIDPTEVSKENYLATYNLSEFSKVFDGSACPLPDAGPQPFAQAPTPLPGAGNVPAVIDWCEADAFCRFVGRRLCGGAGGASINDVRSSEWFNACSPDGRPFPYGDAAVSDCNYSKLIEAVGARRCCVGSVRGVFDMSGNVAEWTSECVSVQGKPPCEVRALRGGSINPAMPAQAGRCNDLPLTNIGTAQRANGGANYAGVRCCADPLPP